MIRRRHQWCNHNKLLVSVIDAKGRLNDSNAISRPRSRHIVAPASRVWGRERKREGECVERGGVTERSDGNECNHLWSEHTPFLHIRGCPAPLKPLPRAEFLAETTSTTSFIGQRPDRARNIGSPPLPCAIYHREAYTATLTIYFHVSTTFSSFLFFANELSCDLDRLIRREGGSFSELLKVWRILEWKYCETYETRIVCDLFKGSSKLTNTEHQVDA